MKDNHKAREIKSIEKNIHELIDDNKDVHNSYELVTSVVGIGFATAVHFISVTENFTRFENVRKLICYPSNNIRLLLEDKTGKLWFGGHGENMFVYDARLNGEIGQGKIFTVLKNKDGKSINNVWSIIEDKKGNIWFGEDGLWRYDGKTFTKVSQTGALAS